MTSGVATPLLTAVCGKADPLGQNREPEQDQGKAERRAEGANPRFAIANFTPEEYAAQALYEQVYCERGREECHRQPSRTARFGGLTSLVGLDPPS